MDLPRLSLATLDRVALSLRPAFDPCAAEVGVVHLGPGAFFRAHQAPVYDRLLAAGEAQWGVCGVSLHSAAVREALGPQDGLYTLRRLGGDEPLQVVGALREVLVGPDEPDQVHARLAAATTGVVTLTVTEKGYHLRPDGELDRGAAAVARDLQVGGAPVTIYGWLAPALRARREAGLAPWLLLSCDNLPENGRKLKRALAAFAHAGGDGGLADWIEAELTAPSSMVDSITPATENALREEVAGVLGLLDAWPIQREPFAQWVIEAADHHQLSDLARAGVTLTHDLAGFERAKLRLLNGAHSTLAYLGLLAGCETVADAMAEPRLAPFVERLMREDLSPTVSPPAGLDLGAYVSGVLARFRNAAIRHRLDQIAADGSQKLPVRLGAPAVEALRADADVRRFAVPFAAWMRWVEVAGDRLRDPLAERLRQAAHSAQGDPAAFFADAGVLPDPLRTDAAFADALADRYRELRSSSAVAAT